MHNLTLIGLGLVLAVAETLLERLLPVEHLVPDLVLALILYMGLMSYNSARGAAIAFVIGYFVDALQPGCPICLNMLVLVSVFLLSRLLTSRLLLAGLAFHVLLVLIGSLFSSLIIIGVRAIFERQVGDLEPLALVVATRAAATAVTAPFVFFLVRRVNAKRGQRREDRFLC